MRSTKNKKLVVITFPDSPHTYVPTDVYNPPSPCLRPPASPLASVSPLALASPLPAPSLVSAPRVYVRPCRRNVAARAWVYGEMYSRQFERPKPGGAGIYVRTYVC